jgi:Electron transfer DM13
MKITESLRRHKLLAIAVSAVLVALLVVAAVLFQPWRLFTSSTVDEALPGSSAATSATSGSAAPSTPAPGSPMASGQPSDPGSAAPSPVPATPAVLTKGNFVSQEHPTSGTASLVKLPDGGLVLRLENLASSDGPDVKIWLSNQAAGGDWFKYRSGKWLDLGAIKATHGNQNYPIPAGADISGLTTVVLWCDRFSVSFGSAALA